MSKRDQHYVPQSYLKAWEVSAGSHESVENRGVYYYTGNAREGELRNRDSILWSPHLYTVSFDQLFIGRGCPKIYSDFVDKVYELMLNRTPQTVYAKYGRSIINTKQGIRKHLDNDRSSQKRRDQPGHILLYGPEGRGKKYKADIIAQEIGNKTSYINGA